ncbi:MAG TPA: phosphopantetheine-binding protein, partial [Pyrinomonadaceae bacterium]|nr:phosphopantetheine-binding protein [Pyrinomonadaceae bacterium]
RVPDEPEAPVTIGRGLWNTRLYILDGRGEPIPEGVAGEVWVAGEGLARGYFGRAGQTAERFRPDAHSAEPGGRAYRTGDVGRWVRGGEVEYLGRGDEQVKVRGYRIELGEIEAALNGHPDVEQSVVVVRTDGAGDKRLVAYVVANKSANGELRTYLKGKLPEYMVPAAFVSLDEIPLTPNGKVNRRALPAPEPSTSEPADGYVAPRDAVEEELAAAWAELLKLERVGVESNFFDLGGHSLLAMRLLSRVRERFQVELEVRALFEAPTVAGMAALVRRAQSRQDSDADAGIEAMLGGLGNLEHLLAELDRLSDDEAERMLDEKESLLKRVIDTR